MKEARRRAQAATPGVRSELRSVDARIARAEQALDRYYEAFESGSLASRRFSSRTELLEQQIAELRRQREELQERLERESLAPPGTDLLVNLRTAIADALEAGTASQRKALLQELVSEIRVESRESILPSYRLPLAPVRVMSGVVDPRLRHKNNAAEFTATPYEVADPADSRDVAADPLTALGAPETDVFRRIRPPLEEASA